MCKVYLNLCLYISIYIYIQVHTYSRIHIDNIFTCRSSAESSAKPMLRDAHRYINK